MNKLFLIPEIPKDSRFVDNHPVCRVLSDGEER